MTEVEAVRDAVELSAADPSATEGRATQGEAVQLRAGTVISVATRIAARVIDGTAVLIVNDEQDIHTLNSVGTFVFEQLDSAPRSVAELVTATHEAFEVEEAEADADVRAFVAELVRLGAFEIEAP